MHVQTSPLLLTMAVNGARVECRVAAEDTLLDVLRERLELTGTKKGCDQGACGACTVLVDGRRVLSCGGEMFTDIGHRPNTEQTIRIGAQRDGEFVAIEHASTNTVAIEHASVEPVTGTTASAYACPNVSTRDQQRRLNIPFPSWMRAPGEAQGNFALESAIDELAHRLGVDPLELRLRNDAAVHPRSGLADHDRQDVVNGRMSDQEARSKKTKTDDAGR